MVQVTTPPVFTPSAALRLELPLAAGDCGACRSQADRWSNTLSDRFKNLEARERRLQDHLRDSVTPGQIEDVPGLDIGVKHQTVSPHWSAGGDFYDVASLGAQRYALLVGEVGGDGLESAEQAAALRLALRFAIGAHAGLGEAVGAVNRFCIRNEVLTEYATLFAAVYNARTGTLVYVNAGHEPALRRHGRTDRVELLGRTGPRLGGAIDVTFEERATTLGVSDTLAIYTDGLIEHAPRCNPSLGLALLMRRVCCDDSLNAAQLAECVFTGTRGDADSQLFRDDACLMTIVRTGTSPAGSEKRFP